MGRIAITCLLVATLTASAAAKKTTNLYEDVWKSVVVYAVDATAHCTAFAVRFDPALYVTARHCFGDDVALGTIDSAKVTVVAVSQELVAVTTTTGRQHPILILGDRPQLGQYVTGMGYGGPYKVPFMYRGVYVGDYPVMGEERKLAVFQQNFVGGMSGGPVVNDEGRVVSVMQCGASYGGHNADFGCGSTYDETSDFIRQVTAR